MSQAQCLPLTRKRGVWSQGEEDQPNSDRHEQKQNSHDIAVQAIQTGTDIDQLQSIDAMEYLMMVHREASSLPNVFVASVSMSKSKSNQYNAENNRSTVSISSSRQNQSSRNRNRNTRHQNNEPYLPIDGSAAMASYLLNSSCTGLPPAQHRYQLPLECSSWVTHTLADFSSLRHYLDQCWAAGVGQDKAKRIPVPSLKDVGGWHEFCLGIHEAEGNVDGYFDADTFTDADADADADGCEEQEGLQGNDDGEVEMDGLAELTQPNAEHIVQQTAEGENTTTTTNKCKTNNNVPEWRNYMMQSNNIFSSASLSSSSSSLDPQCRMMKPFVSLLLQMDQVMTRRVLSHLTSWVVEEDYPITYNRASWIYALLARLEKPLHRDDGAMLRKFLRKCCEMRAEQPEPPKSSIDSSLSMSGNENMLSMLNVLIALVGIYFEQGPQVMLWDQNVTEEGDSEIA